MGVKMRCLRLSTGETGASQFDEVEISLREMNFLPPAPPALVSEQIITEGRMLFATLPVGWDGSWHPAPARSYFFMLSGQLEVEVSGWQRRRIKPGDAVLLEDTSGMGHRTRVIGDSPADGVYVLL